MTDTLEHARQNAQSWLESIREMVSRLEHAQSNCAALYIRGPIQDGDCEHLNPEWSNDDFFEYHDADKAEQAIHESILDLTLSGDWHPGETPEASRYTILLSTGGPALRIVGDLDIYGEPSNARLEMQDWGTPWTEYTPAYPGTPDARTAFTNAAADRWLEDMSKFRETLLTFARCFYFGD